MNEKTILEILAILFFVMQFLMVWTKNEIITIIWVIITIILALLILNSLITQKTKILDEFKKQHVIIQILIIAFIMIAVFELITIHTFSISWIIFIILAIFGFYKWFFKKEE